jgi:hypothetical protein
MYEHHLNSCLGPLTAGGVRDAAKATAEVICKFYHWVWTLCERKKLYGSCSTANASKEYEVLLRRTWGQLFTKDFDEKTKS